MGFMGFWWILILAAVLGAVWFAASAGRGRGMRNFSAEERLKERYAAGEIDQATYERMLRDLRR